MKKQILLPPSILRELRETFKVGRNDLWRALNYERNSDRANALRRAALERGGLIYTGIKAPQGYIPPVETKFDSGMMYQFFGNRVELRLNKETNEARIIIDRIEVAKFNDMTTESWGDVLYSLQQIYNQLNTRNHE